MSVDATIATDTVKVLPVAVALTEQLPPPTVTAIAALSPLPPIEAVTATLADVDSSVCASVLRRRQANYLPTGKLM